jgi:protein required for attachment to host cells
MNDFWILVASRSEAKFYARNRGGKLRLVEKVDHPSGRLKDRDFNTDKPGRSFESGAVGRHSLSGHDTPHDRHAASFARTLAEMLREGRNAHRYAQCVLVAEPRFLGMLRDALDDVTAKTVIAQVPKELTAPGSGNLTAHLRGVLPP